MNTSFHLGTLVPTSIGRIVSTSRSMSLSSLRASSSSGRCHLVLLDFRIGQRYILRVARTIENNFCTAVNGPATQDRTVHDKLSGASAPETKNKDLNEYGQ